MNKEFEKLELNTKNLVKAISLDVKDKTGIMTKKVSSMEKKFEKVDKMIDEFKEIAEFVNTTRSKQNDFDSALIDMGTTIKGMKGDMADESSANSANNREIIEALQNLSVGLDSIKREMADDRKAFEKYVAAHDETHNQKTSMFKKIFG